jgi:restriction system protein
MSDDKNPNPLPPFVEDGSQDAAAIIARNEQRRRQQQAAVQSSAATPEWVPFPRPQPVYVDDGSQDAAAIVAINNEYRRRQSFAAILASMQGGDEVLVHPTDFPVLVSRAVIVAYDKTFEGELIKAQTIPLLAIMRKILEDPSRMYEIDPRTWEEIIAATYESSGQFDRVTLTPRSGDYGRDVIAEKDGFGSVRLIESVKRYKPGNEVTADEVRALLGVLSGDQRATKGVISTTWEFAPKVREDIFIKPFLPYRLELVNGTDLVQRLKEYTSPKDK